MIKVPGLHLVGTTCPVLLGSLSTENLFSSVRRYRRRTGNTTITGADSVEKAKSAFETLNETLDEFDAEELRQPNDAVHDRLDDIANALKVDPEVVTEAHELVDMYDAAILRSSRGDDGVAGTALYLASESLTQSTVAQGQT